MAHKTLEDGRKVVDWTTGDPEGDRITLLSAYRDFVKELLEQINGDQNGGPEEAYNGVVDVINKWQVSTENQIDEVPRVWIKRPE